MFGLVLSLVFCAALAAQEEGVYVATQNDVQQIIAGQDFAFVVFCLSKCQKEVRAERICLSNAIVFFNKNTRTINACLLSISFDLVCLRVLFFLPYLTPDPPLPFR